MPTLQRSGDYVKLTMPGTEVWFSIKFGGIPIEMFRVEGVKKTPVIHNHPGAAGSIAWNTGQDATQGSHNGVDWNEVGELPDYTLQKAFYTYESKVDFNTCLYEVSGYAPFFWVSLDAIDDTIPPLGPLNGWCTLYNNFLNLPASTYTYFGTPIFFSPRSENFGLIFVSNEMENIYQPGKPWNQRVLQIGEGQLACKQRISLKNASNDAIAGVVFRKVIPSTGSISFSEAFSTPGYQLNMNKQGVAQIVKCGVGGIWNSPVNYKVQLNSDAGLTVEIRSVLWDRQRFDVWLDGKFATSLRDTPLGGAVGLFGACASGRIAFYDRCWWDMNLMFQAQYYPTAQNLLGIKTFLWKLDKGPMKLYRTHMPTIFLHPSIKVQKPNSLQLWGTDGAWYNWPSLDIKYPNQWGMYKGTVPTSAVRALWLGSDDSKYGLFCKPRVTQGFMLQQQHVVGVSPIAETCEQTACESSGFLSFESEWAPTVRVDTL